MSHSQESPHAAGLGQTVNLMGWRNHAQNSGRTHGNSQFPASTCGPCSTVPTISAKQSSSIGAHGIGRSPRSHCRHVCRPARQSAAMSGWVSAASARRALSVSDWPSSVAKGPFGPARLGWFGMSGKFVGIDTDAAASVDAVARTLKHVGRQDGCLVVILSQFASHEVFSHGGFALLGASKVCVSGGEVCGDGHGGLSAPVIPRRGGQRCAVHVVNVSQRDTPVKRYLQRFETVTSWGVA